MADRIQVAMEPTSQSILADTTKIKNDVSNVVYPKVVNIESWVGSPTSGQSNSTSANAHAKLNWLTSYVSSIYGKNAGIKSVQRGRYDGYVGYGSNADIVISSVYPSKSFLIVDGSGYGYYSNGEHSTFDTAATAVLDSGGTRIKFPSISSLNSVAMICNWQVIEFY